ncbi:MAG TPA: xanthine dehydrogenase family protein, partial [Chloroflexota bacterium]|nr:xanthine dehydrogenase family protein [Chloroflexota bacterium]
RVDLVVEAGAVTHPETGHSLTFGQLTGGRPLSQPIPEDVPTRHPGAWTVAGTAAPKVNARDLVTGAHRFASDVELPGMLYGKVLRPAGFGATLRSLDAREAEAMPGVTVVREGDFVAVAAPDEPAAVRAVAALRAEWEVPAQPAAPELMSWLREHAAEEPGTAPAGPGRRGGEPYTTGAVEEGLAMAAHVLEATYTAAYIAHAPLEPRAALAQWEAGGLTVWTGTQRPFGVREQLAEQFGLPAERVRVIVPDTGSGYGGKHYGDAAVEAARLARACGKPVKLIWTREEEFTWAYFRPAAVIDVRAGVGQDGTLTAWEHHTYNAGAAGIRTLYDVPHQRIVSHAARAPLRQGSYRALSATANTFARESHMDELAQRAGMDPLAFRLRNLKDERLRAVLEAAAERFGWGRAAAPPGHGYGLACGFEKGGYVATCAEVAAQRRPSGRIADVRLVRVVEAFECGAVLNPEHLRNLIEGAVVQGIGGALYEAIEFAEGRILNPRFSQYRVPRFGDVPPIEVVLLDRKDLPSAGAGETPIIGIAPAVANAIAAATGVRLRGMPLLAASPTTDPSLRSG